jgi:hypothetical protein
MVTWGKRERNKGITSNIIRGTPESSHIGELGLCRGHHLTSEFNVQVKPLLSVIGVCARAGTGVAAFV